ncbi:hypothetical protein [Enterococcus avium]|uniref:hypothetical protein n=1 Tax=Enterococcus avium TaxID=33945 RepID=UPI001F5693B8|nr:hypothetical protein [Enterococcus avium]
MFKSITSITIHGSGGDTTITDPDQAATLFGQLDPLTHDGKATQWLRMSAGNYTAYILQGGCLCSVDVVGVEVTVPPIPDCVKCADQCGYN